MIKNFMRSEIFVLTCLLLNFLFVFNNSISAQWVQSAGPSGGSNLGLTALGDTLYTGNYTFVTSGQFSDVGSVYTSTDHGLNWYADTVGGLKGTVTSMAKIGDTIFAATIQNGLFRKIGSTWENVPSIFNFSHAVLFTHKGNLYSAASSTGVLKSTDRGDSFNFLGNLQANMFKLQALGDTIYVATDEGVYMSLNNGNWLPKFYRGVYGFTANIHDLFVTTLTDSVFKSTDRGNTWFPIMSGLISGYTGDIICSGDTLYTNKYDTAGSHIFRSFNGGLNWTPCSPGNYISKDAQRYARIGSEIFVGSGGGFEYSVGKTTDYGNSWQEANSGLANAHVNDIYDYHGILFTASLYYYGIHKSTDGGNTWKVSTNYINPITTYVNYAWTLAGNSNYIFAGFLNDAGIYRSSDTGATWTSAVVGLNNTSALNVHSLFATDSFLLAGTCDGIFRSTNNGLNWDSTITSGCFYSMTSFSNYIFAGTYHQGIWKSSDNGITWIQTGTGLPASIEIPQLIVRGTDLIAATTQGVYVSSDTGNTWSLLNNSPIEHLNSVAARSDTIIISTEDPSNHFGHLYISYDNGINWNNYDRPGYSYEVSKLRIIGDTLFACTHTHSVWKRALSDTSVLTSINDFSADEISPITIYPNPAFTYLNIYLNERDFKPGSINICDLNGRLITSQRLTEHFTKIDLSDFANGIYFIQYVSGEKIISRKLIVLKQ